MGTWNHAALLLLVGCLAGCCHTARTVNRAPIAATQALPPAGRIAVGDVFKIHLSNIPGSSLVLTVPVESTGTMSLPFGVLLTAAGKTKADLNADIRNAYVPKYFLHLTVQIEELRQERPIRVGDVLYINFTDIPP